MNLINRELSWLSFNERVLQEALDTKVPLTERMRFLGIYSNNLDEFFRVRVANLKRVMEFKNEKIQGFKGTAEELYVEIRKVVMKQQELFEAAYQQIKHEFEAHQVQIVDETALDLHELAQLDFFFHDKLKHAIFPILLDKKRALPKLRDYAIYLGVKITSKTRVRYALIQIPTEYTRFFTLKQNEGQKVILMDDIIRLYLLEIFSVFRPTDVKAYTFKFTRDAELDLDDDLSLSFFEKIEKSLKQRKKGEPVRFVYDAKMPNDLLQFLLQQLDLKKGVNTIPGGRYHNFKDFMRFPDFGNPEFRFEAQQPVAHPLLQRSKSIIQTILKQDILLHFPYQQFDHVIDLLREASLDPKVKEVKINIYRVAKNSEVMNALLACIFNGKQVTVVFELQARFDEENNLWWSNRLKDFGANVIYGLQNLKVHSKLLQIKRINDGKAQYITYVGTGNFNEGTATIYTDLALLTANKDISAEVSRVFGLLENNLERHTFRYLMVSPFNTRRKLMTLIDREIKFAKAKKPAWMRIKINNLTDVKLIEKLYVASKAGVKIEMIIRGICCLKPGVKGLSENITAISIVDRYLEHARFVIFGNGGTPETYISSADWMERNLDQRIEVGAKILDPQIQAEIALIFDYQWRGSVKARSISANYKNLYSKRDLPPFHAQQQLFAHYKQLSEQIAQNTELL
ncbi:MAG: polyphosphate kinase 1 [Bacteroidota bacterium]|jgi:polyphosphate kinase